MIGQTLGLSKNDIFNLWEDRMKQVLETNGMNIQSNLALVNAMLDCARKYIEI